MKKLLLMLTVLFTVACEDEIVQTNKVLDGEYIVTCKIWEQPDGSRKYYYPIGTDVTGLPINGWMSETTLIFAGDSLGISQLMNEGWSTGYVELEWMNDKPYRVGCHYVESVSDTQISWYQDNIIIRNIMVKK